MNDTVRLTASLTGICTVCAVILASAYVLTRGPIARAAAQRRIEAARSVLPPGSPAPQPVVAGNCTGYVTRVSAGGPACLAAEGHSDRGYGGPIDLMIGFDASGKVCGYRVLRQTETPGLGTKVDAPAFRGQIVGRPAGDTCWTVRKDGGEIDAITGATISSRAVLEAVRDAIRRREALAAAAGGTPPTAQP